MDSTRQKKIGRLLQKEMGEIFQREVRDVVKGTMVSVTVARVSSDMGVVKIFLSIFPTEHKDEVFKNIKQHSSQLRFLLGKRVGKQLRVIPELQFFIDDSLDYAERIDDLLKH
jgi:ribosome-binding factor A